MLEKKWLEKFSENYQKAKLAGEFGSFSTSPVNLTTASEEKPSNRMVLLKSFDENGFVIYTNFNSRKGEEIKKNPQVCLVFFWPKIGKKILVSGAVEMISNEASDAYFATRPFFSKVGAHASKQSQKINFYGEFFLRLAFFSVKFFLQRHVPRPKNWRGFRVIPQKIFGL